MKRFWGGSVILAGDVGGTKCNLALFAEKDGKLHVVFRQRFASKDFARFDLIIREFTRQAAPHLTDEKVRAAGFGVAGPVINNRIHATNLPWVIDADNLSKELGVKTIALMNDLGATGHSLEHLSPEDFVVLNPGTPVQGATRALLAAGTGLGQSILFSHGNPSRVVPIEVGHSAFAPHTDKPIQLLQFTTTSIP